MLGQPVIEAAHRTAAQVDLNGCADVHKGCKKVLQTAVGTKCLRDPVDGWQAPLASIRVTMVQSFTVSPCKCVVDDRRRRTSVARGKRFAHNRRSTGSAGALAQYHAFDIGD